MELVRKECLQNAALDISHPFPHLGVIFPLAKVEWPALVTQ